MTGFDKDSIYRAWDEPLDADGRAALDEACAADPALRDELEVGERLRADLRALGSMPGPTRPPLDWSSLDPPRRVSRSTAWVAAAAVVIGVAGALWAIGGPGDEVGMGQPGPLATHAPPTPQGSDPEPGMAPPVDDGRVEVAFGLVAPDAATVAVAGDFNDWKPSALLMSASTAGRWQARAALPPGRYAYMYVVDGQWITPPDAQRTQDDGFGARNGVLHLLPPPGV